MVFSRQLSQQMRGFAILCVCMHNLLHLVCRAKECEFAFYPERVDRLMAASVTPWNLVECFFSFFGWYFILVFVMFSGYGLVCKHEKVEKGEMKVRSYLWHNFLKLFVLLAPGYLLYLLLNDKPVEWYAVVSQLTLTINLIDFEWIAPGVYWYLGLTMQFYLIYLFFHRFRDRRWLVMVSLLAIVLAVAILGTPDKVHQQVRYNSLVWLPVLVTGIWWARYPVNSLHAFLTRHWMASSLVLTALWLLSAVCKFVWVLSPLFAIWAIAVASQGVASLSHTKHQMLSRIGRAMGRFLSFMGGISAGVYVCHPIVRIFAIKAIIGHTHIIAVTCVYMLFSVLTGYLYTALYKRLK